MVIGAVVGLALIALLSLSPSISSSLKISIVELLSPLQSVAHDIFLPLGDLVKNVGRIIQAAGANPGLEERADSLVIEIVRLKEVEAENRALSSLLKFERREHYSGVVARVIGRDLSHWNQSILINKGGADGVVKEAAVISAQGVVGKIIEVAPHLSRVLLIIDRTSGVGGIIQDSRQTGIVEGRTGGGCVMKYLPRRLPVSPGEVVITSGLGQVYPPGLLIGTVTTVYEEEFGLYKSAELKPAARFNQLELVMVLER